MWITPFSGPILGTCNCQDIYFQLFVWAKPTSEAENLPSYSSRSGPYRQIGFQYLSQPNVSQLPLSLNKPTIRDQQFCFANDEGRSVFSEYGIYWLQFRVGLTQINKQIDRYSIGCSSLKTYDIVSASYRKCHPVPNEIRVRQKRNIGRRIITVGIPTEGKKKGNKIRFMIKSSIIHIHRIRPISCQRSWESDV